MNIQDFSINAKDFRKSCGRIQDNSIIASYYREMDEAIYDDFFARKARRVESCYKLWDIDYYIRQGVKDVLRINLCKDKFCKNCQSVISKRRYFKYVDFLNDLSEQYDIYHVTFTVPNCSLISLKSTLNQMYQKFVYVNQYFQCKRKIKGINFAPFGYNGSVRSLELTMNYRNGALEVHPHFHCLFLLRKGLKFKRTIINDYSFDTKTGKLKQKFTSFDILLQKIWFLVYNSQKVTKKSIDQLPLGYSCLAQKIPKGDYKEVFKYTLKDSFDIVKTDFGSFESVYRALHRRKVIQGYGILNRFDFEDPSIAEEVEERYVELINALLCSEDPRRCYEKLVDVDLFLREDSPITYISKSSIRRDILDDKQ